MTSDDHLNGPFVWNGRLSMALATALRDLRDGNPHYAQAHMRAALEAYLAESGCDAELADTLAQTARLPRPEGGTTR